jgi:hypothetical protein
MSTPSLTVGLLPRCANLGCSDLEFAPSKYSNMDRLSPAGSVTENPEDWNSYWVECLADSGITGLADLERSWLVPIEEISDPNIIKQYLTTEIGEYLSAEYDPEYIGALCGGFALRSGGETLVWPGCCGDLGDIKEWKIASEYKRGEWVDIWIGHPTISVYFDGKRLIISEAHEPLEKPARNCHSIAPKELLEAISKAEAQIVRFRERIQPILAEYISDELAEEASRILVEGH